MSRRPAFTLVELLVVAGVFALLFGLVLNGAKPGIRGQYRQAAQSLASVLLATQSKALGNPAGAGVILDPSAGAAVTTVSAADMLPLITGQCTSGMPPANLAATTAGVAITPTNADAADLTQGYKIRFQERDPAVQPPSAWLGFSSPNVSFRAGNGQRPQNTIWPKAVGGGAFDVEIARYPNEGETLLEFPKDIAIDLSQSGVGDGGTWDSDWSQLSGKGAIGITFNSLGEIDVLMQQVLSTASRSVQPVAVGQPVYLLLAARADIQSGVNTLSRSDAVWVAMHPQTGRVTVSSNVPQTGTGASALRNARANARAGLGMGK